MSPDAALAYTAFLVCVAGFIAAVAGFTFPGDEGSTEAKVSRAVGIIGAVALVAALIMWIISIWMQVR